MRICCGSRSEHLNERALTLVHFTVSPIMGPVVAMAYGTTIFDRKMVHLAMTNELVSLLCCILVGVVVGACTGMVSLGVLAMQIHSILYIQYNNTSSFHNYVVYDCTLDWSFG